jgi:hypothetical protein
MSKAGFRFGVLLLLALLVPSTVASAQTGPAGAPSTLSGILTVISGDPRPGSGLAHRHVSSVTTAGGRTHALVMSDRLAETAGGIHNLNGKRVTVRGIERESVGGRPTTIDAESIEVTGPSALPEALTGSQKFVNILCRYADATTVTPKSVAYMEGLVGDAYPGVGHFWRENSFNLINNTGSVVKGWYNLPQPRSYYVFDNEGQPGIDFDRLAGDCTALADPTVNFNEFLGINLVFNQNLDCCAWGGVRVLTLDGTNKAWPMTWLPPWAVASQNVLAHEMGHAYGLPHSSGDYGAVYDSGWDVMSNGGRAFGTPDPTYGSLGTHTISYHKDRLGWIASSRKYTAAPNSCQVVTLDQLSQVPSTTGTYLMAQVPRGTNRFYTIEARKNAGYDAGRIPAEAIVIHDVLTTRPEPAHVVDATTADSNPNDAGAMWLPGETFTDTANGVRIHVRDLTANGWLVEITSGTGVCSGPTPATLAASPSSVARGSAVTATWSGVAGPTSNDWIGLYPSSSAPNTDRLAWRYTTGTASGNVNLTVPSDTAIGTTYELRLFANNTYTRLATSGAFTVTGVPDNDAFANAQALSGPSGSLSGTNANATKEVNEPDHARPGGKSVWYRWTASRTADASFDTWGSDIDTLLAVYTGTAVNALTPISANNDADGYGVRSKLYFSAVAGTEYRIAVDGNNGASGNITLNWNTSPLAPSNLTLTSPGPNTVRMNWQDNAATEDGFWVFVDGNYTPPNVAANTTTRDVNDLQQGTRYCFRVSAFNSGGGSALTPETCITTGSTSATIAASPSSVARGSALTATWSGVASPAANDWIGLYASSGAPNTDRVAWRYTTGTASGNAPLTVPAGAAVGTTYELRLFSNNSYTRLATSSAFTVTGSTSATIAASPSSVARGSALTATWSGVASPASNDWIGLYASSGAANTDRVAWRYTTGTASGNAPLTVPAGAAVGTTYELRLFSNNSYTRLATSSAFTVTSGPVNDAFANAQVISGASGGLAGANSGATKETNEPDHATPGGLSVWYRWTASRTADVSFDTGGSSFDTLLAVYTGSAVNGLTHVTSNDDADGFGLQSKVYFSAVSGTEYRIAVDGYYGASGNFTLNWNTSPVAPGNLTVTSPGPDTVRMSWQDNSGNEDGFWIFVDGNYTPPNVAANTTTRDVSGLQQGTRYCFRVSSFNSGGGSALSPEACTTTPGVVSKPV